MAVNVYLTKAYAKAIYLDGTKKFSEIMPAYVEPVKKLAATNYTKVDIDAALAKGFITQFEYDETITLKYPDGNIPLDISTEVVAE